MMYEWCYTPQFCTDYTGPGITWGNEMNFGVNHAPCAVQTIVLRLCYDYPLYPNCKYLHYNLC